MKAQHQTIGDTSDLLQSMYHSMKHFALVFTSLAVGLVCEWPAVASKTSSNLGSKASIVSSDKTAFTPCVPTAGRLQG